jgi:alkanesulfonate monooxygenase SsuD/methylene tetrahydromethanopterin reductase-like flavin-dependent oxidoreductase (luciferase family)
LLWFVNTSMKSAPQYAKFLPGTTPPELAPQLYRNPSSGGSLGRPGRNSPLNRPGVTAELAMAGGRMYAGNPDTVYRQIMDFYDKVGGFGHLIMVGKTGHITHDEAVKNITLFSKEVLPRLREVKPVVVE